MFITCGSKFTKLAFYVKLSIHFTDSNSDTTFFLSLSNLCIGLLSKLKRLCGVTYSPNQVVHILLEMKGIEVK